MFNLTKTFQELEETRKKFHWVINGLGRTGFKISDVNKITWDFIVINYNVNDFRCNHLKVSEVGYVITASGKVYDGYCDICENQVFGKTEWGTLRNNVK